MSFDAVKLSSLWPFFSCFVFGAVSHLLSAALRMGAQMIEPAQQHLDMVRHRPLYLISAC